MSIGLWDDDFMTYKQPFFNLEIMKMATYYKQRNEIVKFATKLEPEMYTKFFVRKDYDNGVYPKEFFLPNVEYGGHAFTNKYKSLDSEIEKTKPDQFIYSPFKKWFYKELPIFRTMLSCAHVRLSLDGKTVWEDYDKPLYTNRYTQSLILHDYNLGCISGEIDAIKDIVKKVSHGNSIVNIGVKFPIQVYNDEDLQKWLNFKNLSGNLYWMRYFGIMSNESFKQYINSRASNYPNIEYYVTYACSDENHFITERLPIICMQVINSQMSRSLILLKYEDNFFQDKRWERLLEFLNFYSRARKDSDRRKTIYTFARQLYGLPKHRKYDFEVEEVRDLFQLVREKNYNVFKMFYEEIGEDLRC